MSAEIEEWPPPNDATAFESLCLDLWKEIWNDSGAQKNGRSGQAQAGIDVFGRCDGQHIGIQCKQKDGLLRHKITVAELEHAAEAAKGFRPALATFILATTGHRDVEVQKCARLLSEENKKEGLFNVEVWSWKEIWREIYQRKSLFNKIGPLYWPQLFKHSDVGAEVGSRKRKRTVMGLTVLLVCFLGFVFFYIHDSDSPHLPQRRSETTWYDRWLETIAGQTGRNWNRRAEFKQRMGRPCFLRPFLVSGPCFLPKNHSQTEGLVTGGNLTGIWELTIDKLPPGRFVSIRFPTSNSTNANAYIRFASGNFYTDHMANHGITNELRFFLEGEYQRSPSDPGKQHFLVPIVFTGAKRTLSSLSIQSEMGRWRTVFLNHQ